jgi:hypothetical protein
MTVRMTVAGNIISEFDDCGCWLVLHQNFNHESTTSLTLQDESFWRPETRRVSRRWHTVGSAERSTDFPIDFRQIVSAGPMGRG